MSDRTPPEGTRPAGRCAMSYEPDAVFELNDAGEAESECCGAAPWDPENYEPPEDDDAWSGGFARDH